MTPIDAILFYFRNVWEEVACRLPGRGAPRPVKACQRNKHSNELSRDMPRYCLKNRKLWGKNNRIFPSDTTLTLIENDASNASSVVAYVFVAAITYLPSRCVASI
jgi:hypothetical protein